MSDFDDLTDPRREPTILRGPGGRVIGARHGRRHRGFRPARLLVGVAMLAGISVVTAGSLTAYAAYDLGHRIAQNAVDVGGAGGQSTDGAFNVLAVAADNDPGQGTEYGLRQATLNDANVLLHVSADHTQAVAISFPRDLLVDQPACTSHGTTTAAVQDTPLNEAYGRGGLGCVVRTVEQVSGLRIPYAAQMSFDGIIGLSDAIGGVPVCVTDDVDDPYTGLRLRAGEHTVSGATALAFLRDRHGIGDQSDLSRISSLQQFLSSLVRKVKGNGTLGDPAKLYGLARVASHTVKLSTTLTDPSTMVAMARTFQGIGLDRITFVQYPGATDDPDHPGKVVPDSTTARQLMAAVRSDRSFSLAAGSVGRGSESVSGGSSGSGGSSAAGGSSGASGGGSGGSGSAGSGGSGSGGSGSDADSGSGSGSGSAGSGGAGHEGTSASARPETISGVTGQTAQQRTCAVAAG
ncbi:LCP family protein [Curtobacterium sp. MCBD17_035]|uniref:LCP family protein n=1 Tax=Curtobacterium sp. MCBD17_035 TaxID=2175673 RepID=UPI000DA9595C|nr:LCP family protein [Curtobacterium sp. MCBD17_035]WIB68105.1 LCP family protein [Curtobacterium sp. MCBD17_035]